MTAWRILHQQGYLTSYNHNAKYYTLTRIAQFDEQGLWALPGHSLQQVGNAARYRSGPD